MQTAGSGPDSPSTTLFATLPLTASGHTGNLGSGDGTVNSQRVRKDRIAAREDQHALETLSGKGGKMREIVAAAIGLALVGMAGSAHAAEYFVGSAIEQNGIRIAAAYVLGVTMEPMMSIVEEHQEVIHLEADIAATADNQHGFGAGDWVPYLTIAYEIRKKGSDWSRVGAFMPMIATDGPHYAANVSMDGPGDYHVVYRIDPPTRKGFFRHSDDATGVPKWWAPFEVAWDFSYPSRRIED